MRNAAADELYDYYQNELEELKEENRADYEDVMSCAEEQMADAKEKLTFVKNFRTVEISFRQPASNAASAADLAQCQKQPP